VVDGSKIFAQIFSRKLRVGSCSLVTVIPCGTGKMDMRLNTLITDIPSVSLKRLALAGIGNFQGCHAHMHCHAYITVVKVLTHTSPTATLWSASDKFMIIA
jgi:hypothetical protein